MHLPNKDHIFTLQEVLSSDSERMPERLKCKAGYQWHAWYYAPGCTVFPTLIPWLHHSLLWSLMDPFRKDFFTNRVVKHWNRLPGRWWSCRSWKCSRNNWMWLLVPRSSWQGGDGSKVGLRDPGGLFQLNDSTILTSHSKQSFGKGLKNMFVRDKMSVRIFVVGQGLYRKLTGSSLQVQTVQMWMEAKLNRKWWCHSALGAKLRCPISTKAQRFRYTLTVRDKAMGVGWQGCVARKHKALLENTQGGESLDALMQSEESAWTKLPLKMYLNTK